MNKNYTKMASYSFCEACQNSVSSNWRVFKSELEGMFDVELTINDLTKIISEMIKNFGNAILDITLDKEENIATCEDEYVIDFVLGTNYCLNVEEEESA